MSHQIILNDSTMFSGTVRVSTFVVSTTFGDLSFDISQIWYIDYKSQHYDGKDALFTSDGSAFSGEVLPEIVPIEVSSQVIDFPKTDINFLMLSGSKVGDISEDTRSKLGAIDT